MGLLFKVGDKLKYKPEYANINQREFTVSCVLDTGYLLINNASLTESIYESFAVEGVLMRISPVRYEVSKVSLP